MARTRGLACSTSITSEVTPRAWARATSARINAEPRPRPCHASATTTPISVTLEPGAGLVRGHGVSDDDAIPDGDHGVDVGVAARQQVEQAGVGVTGPKNLR